MKLPKDIPISPGVYLMKDKDGQILYIGKSKCLRNRVRSYFQSSLQRTEKIERMLEQVTSIDFEITSSEIEALVLESRLIKQNQPKYNTISKDSCSSQYWILTKDPFPIASLAYEYECTQPENLEFYGPFLSGYILRQSFRTLQRVFRFRTCHLAIPKEGARYRPCLFAAIKHCSAPCCNRISHTEYNKDIHRLRQFLSGFPTDLLKELDVEMLRYSSSLQFEHAMKIRDQIQALSQLHKNCTYSNDFMPGQLLTWDVQKSLTKLQDLLGMSFMPRIIEGIDIAHHQGNEAVGSMVCFVEGMPCKEGYRRYKIEGKYTQNDFAMIQEVLQRRFCGTDSDREYPDVLLVDGGKGQLHAAMAVLNRLKITSIKLIALAKQNEEFFLPNQEFPCDLPTNSPVHHILCYIRDEAHRFAQQYHKKLKNSRVKLGR